MKKKQFLFAVLLLLATAIKPVMAQDKVVDEIVAVVGGHPIVWSDVETQYQQARSQGTSGGPDVPETAALPVGN